MKIYINNFVNSYPVQVSPHKSTDPAIGCTVMIYQHLGALIFQHNMKPDQARAMAAALITCAEEAEKEEPVT